VRITRILGNGSGAPAVGYRRIASGEILRIGGDAGVQVFECAGPSIHGAIGGRYELCLERRTLVLDEDVCVMARPERRLRGRLRTGASALALCFPPDALVRIGGVDDDSRICEHLRTHGRATEQAMRQIAGQLDAGFADPAWYEEQAYFILGRLLSRGQAQPRTASRRLLAERLARATDLIHSAYERPLSLADLATAASLSTFHMLRAFKDLHGVTPYEYLQRRRLAAGLRLLNATDEPIREIAGRVGFADVRSFRRMAMRELGLGPRLLREDKKSGGPKAAASL
jgi:AraC-like DNA-binding protein